MLSTRTTIAIRTLAIRTVALGLGLLGLSSGCSLDKYRRQADAEAYSIVAGKSDDPRWAAPGFNIELDPRSRYYDEFDPVRPPMPPDDPPSHVYMHEIDGMKGWAHWHDNGDRSTLENTRWRRMMPDYVDMTADGEVVMTLDTALDLAYLHSPVWQRQVETLYLSALDVSAERFRLSSQFFAGTVSTWREVGRLRPDGPRNAVTNESEFQWQRRFARAGEVVVTFANSMVWQFVGGDTNSNVSLVNLNIVQPLLRGAGQDRALETLTRAERGMLGNVRELERYRQGFYTNVAIGSLGVDTVSRLGGFAGGTGLTGFSGTGAGGLGGVGAITGFGGGFRTGGGGGGAGGGTGLAGGGAGSVGGFIGLLQSLQEIRNAQYSLDLQLRTLSLLEANLAAGTIDLTQVDQFRQNIETLRAQLLQARAALELAQDTYKASTLGLPPDMPMKLDDSFIDPFQLIDPEAIELQGEVVAFQDKLGTLGANPPATTIEMGLAAARELLDGYAAHYDQTKGDMEELDQLIDDRLKAMEPSEYDAFRKDMAQLADDFNERPGIFQQMQQELDQIHQLAQGGQAAESLRRLVVWARQFGDEIQSLVLIQARARLESITLEKIDLNPVTALNIARANRMDYMNNRAALVDSWRLIAFNADQLQGVLNVEFNADIQTLRDNPVDFRTAKGSMNGVLRFDAPLTRLLERNNYRQSLIDYQQARRSLIQFDDSLNLQMRNQLRTLGQLATNLEIQRRAVVIAIRRVDFTRAQLNRPAAPTPAGAAAQAQTFGPTAVRDLLSALSDLSNAQNNFMSVWLNYYAARMQLMRDLGIMQLDERGRWIDRPLQEVLDELACQPPGLPPVLPEQWWLLPNQIPGRAAGRPAYPPGPVFQSPLPGLPEQTPAEELPTPPLPPEIPTAARIDRPVELRTASRR